MLRRNIALSISYLRGGCLIPLLVRAALHHQRFECLFGNDHSGAHLYSIAFRKDPIARKVDLRRSDSEPFKSAKGNILSLNDLATTKYSGPGSEVFTAFNILVHCWDIQAGIWLFIATKGDIGA